MLNALLLWIWVPLLPTYSRSIAIVLADLLLQPEIPVLVIAHIQIVYRSASDRLVAVATERRAQEEVRKRAIGTTCRDRSEPYPQQERRHEKIHAAVRILAFERRSRSRRAAL